MRDHATEFSRAPVREKYRLLCEIRERIGRVAERWADAANHARRVEPTSPTSSEAWLLGPGISARLTRLYARSLEQIERRGEPDVTSIGTTPTGGQKLRVTPADWIDRAFFPGVEAETWLLPNSDGAVARRAAFYARQRPEGQVALVLGAGNVDSIAVMDVLHSLFVEGRACVLKLNPFNDYLRPILGEVFQTAIERGWLYISTGGADVGAYLVAHPLVDTIHITGSQASHDAILWGTGEEALQRRSAGTPRVDKPLTSELGNVSPAIVVPSNYTDEELEDLAQCLTGMFVNNAAVNCVSSKVIVVPGGWSGRARLMARIASILRSVAPRVAFYPGTVERYETLLGAGYPVQRLGQRDGERLPWALVSGLGGGEELRCFLTVEPFCPVLAEVQLPEQEPEAFLQSAVDYVNQHVPGTLACDVLVRPSWLADATWRPALDASVARLRYGTVCINSWGGLAYALGSTPWGGYPGATLKEPGSGTGWVHNALMLEMVEKSVVRGPLRGLLRPVWHPAHRSRRGLARRFCEFEGSGSASALVRLGWHAAIG